jgi:hypothetical protein
MGDRTIRIGGQCPWCDTATGHRGRGLWRRRLRAELPRAFLATRAPGQDHHRERDLAPRLVGMPSSERAHQCEARLCRLPVTPAVGLGARILAGSSSYGLAASALQLTSSCRAAVTRRSQRTLALASGLRARSRKPSTILFPAVAGVVGLRCARRARAAAFEAGHDQRAVSPWAAGGSDAPRAPERGFPAEKTRLQRGFPGLKSRAASDFYCADHLHHISRTCLTRTAISCSFPFARSWKLLVAPSPRRPPS